jgi:hypothetical protein
MSDNMPRTHSKKDMINFTASFLSAAVPGQKNCLRAVMSIPSASDIRKARDQAGKVLRRERDASLKHVAWLATFVNGFKACAAIARHGAGTTLPVSSFRPCNKYCNRCLDSAKKPDTAHTAQTLPAVQGTSWIPSGVISLALPS